MKTGYIKLDKINRMHYQLSGNMQGKPVLFIHGGPGSGIGKIACQYIDLDNCMLIEYDQRGCGKSTPNTVLEGNNSQNLINDITILLNHLKQEKVTVAGSSWGSTLALLYAQANPHRVDQLHLAGLFLARDKGLNWFMSKGGSSRIIPDLYAKLESQLPIDLPRHYQQIAQHYHNMVTSGVLEQQKQAVECFLAYHDRLAFISAMPVDETPLADKIAKTKVITSYIKNKFYLADNQILNNLESLKNIPITITQGRFDLLCLVEDVYQFKEKFTGQLNIEVVEDSGHVMSEKMKISFYNKINSSK